MASLLKGVSLIQPSGEPFKGSLEGKHLMLYFSASWCPPCKAFSPLLSEWYNKHVARGDLELIYVSSDRDLASFKSYAGHFPFPSIPFEDRPIRQKLSSLFGITGIPCLVVADPQGNLITKAGREGVSTDPENFPWRPRSLAEVIEGPLVRADHSVLPSAGAHIKGKKVALYFSASWCGPCKKFSPILKECYAATRDRGFEVIFVSADHDEPSFAAYFGEMPWTAIPFGDPRIEALNSHFEVEGIPTTIFLDGDSLRVLHKELRPFVMSDSKGVNFPWRPVAVSELSQAFLGNINDVACALIFLPAGKKFAEFENVAKETAARILAEAEASGKDAAIRFAIAEHENGLADSIRGFLNQNAQSEPELVLLDIPAAKKYVFRNVPITGESIAKVAGEYLAGNLAGAKGIKDGDFVPKAAPGGGHGHSHGGAECHGHGGHDDEEEEEEEEEHGHSHDHNAPGHSHSH